MLHLFNIGRVTYNDGFKQSLTPQEQRGRASHL